MLRRKDRARWVREQSLLDDQTRNTLCSLLDPASPPSFEALLGAVEKAGYRAEIADQSVGESKNPSRLEDG